MRAEPAPPVIDPQQQQQLLQAIESGSMQLPQLMELAVEGQTTQLRQAAAAAIHDPAAWQALLPRLRGRDKVAYRLIRQRHEARLAEQRRLAEATSDAEALCAAIEKHAHRPHDARYAATLAQYTERYLHLPEGVDAMLRDRARLAIDRCQEVIAAHERDMARVAALRAEEEARAREAGLLAQQQADEARAAAEAQAAAEVQAAADPQLASATPDSSTADPVTDDDPDTDEPATHEDQAAEAKSLSRIASLIRLSGAALSRGETRKAAWFRQSIEAARADVPALPAQLARRLEQLDTRLNELRQWKDYAAAPKRIELIEAMEALIGVDEEPATLVEHIRALRQEWRTINKGLAVEATGESQRFETAYAAAFQPCQVYLAEQAALRRANLEARRQVLERVQAFEAGLDDAQPDHPMIQRVLREAPREWRSHAPVDREAGRPLDTQFFGVLDRLRARIAAWHEANAAARQALIARAAQLAASTDLQTAIDEAKRLQAQWKSIGPVPHAQSEKMWQEFRSHCNAVFERRQQQFAQQSAAQEQARSAAEEMCRQIEMEAQLGPPDRAAGEARLAEWDDAFNALGELPRNEARSVRTRFQRAISAYQSAITALKARDAQAVEDQVLAAAQRVRAFQRAVIEEDAGADALKAAAETFLDGIPRWPGKGVAQALRQALARAGSGQFTSPDDEARQHALRRLCIHAEILAGLPTPPQDAGQRREQELQLLSQGLGQARQTDARSWEAMRIEWLGLDAAPPGVHEELEQRFMRCFRRGARPQPMEERQ